MPYSLLGTRFIGCLADFYGCQKDPQIDNLGQISYIFVKIKGAFPGSSRKIRREHGIDVKICSISKLKRISI